MSISTTYSELDEMCSALTASVQLEVVSSDTNDTVGGTGVQSVIIGFIDNSNVFNTEILNLSGTTPVKTVTTSE